MNRDIGCGTRETPEWKIQAGPELSCIQIDEDDESIRYFGPIMSEWTAVKNKTNT